MNKQIAVVATMDTKGLESDFIRSEIERFGGTACLIDIGVVGEPKTNVDYSNQMVVEAAGEDFEKLRQSPTRQEASPIMIRGTAKILLDKIAAGEIQAVVGLGGTQGTPNCAQIFQQLPYGFPKIILSTIASGDTKGFMDIKDITMMPSVADILGLNPFSRKILSNLAGAAYGMAASERKIEKSKEASAFIGMTNLGVLTDGANVALELFEKAGFEVIVFHAVGTGGRAMEQMMREGLLTAVFDYALGEIADGCYDCLRAATDERLTVAAELGLPQVICPGGAEHLGIWVDEADSVPDDYKNHQYVFHNPYVFVPRLNSEEIVKVGETIGQRLSGVKGDCCFMIPEKGVSRYSVEGGSLVDRESDAAFFNAIESSLPGTIELQRHPLGAEDPEFVKLAVNKLISMIQAKS